MLVDTHAHLNFSDYETDLEGIITNAKSDGIEKIVCASSNLADSKRAIEISIKYPQIVFPACGIHPQRTDPENRMTIEEQLKELEKLFSEKGVVAIGECGLDYSPAPEGEEDRPVEEQKWVFEGQIVLSQRYHLPLIIHSRKATDETLQILCNYQNLRGVFHFYSFGKSKIAKVLEMGFFFGIDGNITYEEGLQNVVKEVPLEKIILETDSPYLSPIPFRGLRNEPKNVKIVASKLAELKSVPLKEVEEVTTKNASQLFNLK